MVPARDGDISNEEYWTPPLGNSTDKYAYCIVPPKPIFASGVNVN